MVDSIRYQFSKQKFWNSVLNTQWKVVIPLVIIIGVVEFVVLNIINRDDLDIIEITFLTSLLVILASIANLWGSYIAYCILRKNEFRLSDNELFAKTFFKKVTIDINEIKKVTVFRRGGKIKSIHFLGENRKNIHLMHIEELDQIYETVKEMIPDNRFVNRKTLLMDFRK